MAFPCTALTGADDGDIGIVDGDQLVAGSESYGGSCGLWSAHLGLCSRHGERGHHFEPSCVARSLRRHEPLHPQLGPDLKRYFLCST